MILKNALLVDENFKLKRLDLKTEGEKIAEIAESISEDGMDLSGKYILPGFIDTHIHGAAGTRIDSPDFEPNKVTRYEVTQGVTSIAITSASSDFEVIFNNYERVYNASKNRDGAKLAAIHAEGPFLNKKYKGAMTEKYIIAPDTDKLDKMLEKSGGLLRLITIAPENEGAAEFIKHAVKKGVSVSMGHTDSSYGAAISAIEAGATQATHTFNAMRPLNHREPGILGAALTEDSVTCEMICDYIHLHPAAIKLIYKIKGADKIRIISDSGHAAGSNLTQFDVNGIMRYVKDGAVRLADGTIAGSAMSMHGGIKNLLRDGYPIEDVSKMASINPAKSIKIDDITGSLKAGKLADIVVLDENFDVYMTIVNGKCEYQKQ